MGVRLQPGSMAWTSAWAPVAELLLQTGRSRGAGKAALGAGIERGIAGLVGGIRAKKAEAKADARYDREFGLRLEQWQHEQGRGLRSDARADAAQAMTEAQLAQENLQRAQMMAGDVELMEGLMGPTPETQEKRAKAQQEVQNWETAAQAARSRYETIKSSTPPVSFEPAGKK